MFGGKSLSEIPARDLLPLTMIIVLAFISLLAISGIARCMDGLHAWEFVGADGFIGPVLIGLRSVRIVGLALLALRRKAGFQLFIAGTAGEVVLYIVLLFLAPTLLIYAMQLLDLTPFELIVSVALLFLAAPLVLWNLIADRWESLK